MYNTSIHLFALPAMDELDQRLEELVLEAQKYPPGSPRRRKIVGELWDIMLPHLRNRPPKPTDAEARRRLVRLRNSCHARYGARIEGYFDPDWDDVLQDAPVEVLTKTIDIYKKGVDYPLFQEYRKFREKLKQQPNPEVYAEFCQQVEKFRIRFLQRRTRGKKSYLLEKAERLAQACQTFCDAVTSSSSEADLQQPWDDFCHEVQQLYRPLKFWNWFDFYVKMRCMDKIRERVQPPPPPPTPPSPPPEPQTRIPKEVAEIIDQDPDEIFRRKHVLSYPDANFREIALLKLQGASLQQINEHFNNQVNAQTTIGPFYSRACRYFQPIIKEYLEAQIALPPAVIDEIIQDADGKYSRKQMKNHPNINFQGIIQARLGGVPSWRILAEQLQVSVWELIYFYLDCIKSFNLIPRTKRHRRNQEDND